MTRRFFKQTFTITVLSEDVPLEYDDLGDIAHEIDTGDCVGSTIDATCEEITPKQTADLLTQFGSEPDFFQLDAEGNERGE